VRTQLNRLESVFGPKLHIRNFGRSERFVVEVNFANLLEVAAWLRMEENFRMDFLEAFTVSEGKGKFILTYFIRSNSQNMQLVLRTSVPVPGAAEFVEVPSMIGVWPHVEPFENELSPLFGIRFDGARGAGDIRKNFGTYDGFPLRKAFTWRDEYSP
jgi:NADH:ubiquinone oxidoreductase subunit C